MCVIMVKPSGINMPTDTLINDMWDTNDDGAGFMYALKNKVYIEKGFMRKIDFTNAIAGMEKRVKKWGVNPKDLTVIMHFRITTHGGTNQGNTHPFPISSKNSELKKLNGKFDMAMAHNGIINSVTATADISDTMQYIRDILHPLYLADKDFLEKDSLVQLIENTMGGSRLAFLKGDGTYYTIGHWERSKEHEGLLFSNLNFEKWAYSYGAYGYTGWGYDSYDEDYRGRNYGGIVYEEKVEVNLPLKPVPKGVFLVSEDIFNDDFTINRDNFLNKGWAFLRVGYQPGDIGMNVESEATLNKYFISQEGILFYQYEQAIYDTKLKKYKQIDSVRKAWPVAYYDFPVKIDLKTLEYEILDFNEIEEDVVKLTVKLKNNQAKHLITWEDLEDVSKISKELKEIVESKNDGEKA